MQYTLSAGGGKRGLKWAALGGNQKWVFSDRGISSMLYGKESTPNRYLTGSITTQPPHSLFFPLALCNKLLLAGEIQFIPGCKELVTVLENRVPDDRLIFFCAQDNYDGWIVLIGFHPVLKQPHIHVHLSDILVRQFSGL